MSYKVAFDPEAEADLVRLPPKIALEVLGEIELFAWAPAAVSEQVRFPYPQIGQIYQFWGTGEANRWQFTVVLQYGQDEQTLHVLAVGVVRYD